MDLDTLMNETPTVTPRESMELFQEILLRRPEWRCYSSAVVPSTRDLAQRFLRLHAQTPGWLSASIIALHPMAVLRGVGVGYDLWGVVYLNGAIIQVTSHALKNSDLLFFVAEETAHGWSYPEQGWVSTPTMFSATPLTF